VEILQNVNFYKLFAAILIILSLFLILFLFLSKKKK